MQEGFEGGEILFIRIFSTQALELRRSEFTGGALGKALQEGTLSRAEASR